MSKFTFRGEGDLPEPAFDLDGRRQPVLPGLEGELQKKPASESVPAESRAVSAGDEESPQTIIVNAAERGREALLNEGCDRELVLTHDNCELIELNEKLAEAFRNLRHGYPDLPYAEQCQGREFRRHADLIIDAIAARTLQGLDPSKVVVMMPWRAGLAFSGSYQRLGVNKFYHVSSRRDEETLETIVDYEAGHVDSDDLVVMADPMLATGNTAIDAIGRMLAGGLAPDQIIVNAVVAAPVGVRKVKRYPAIRVVAGALDEKLDHRGYIVPGLGDFGDKYYGDFTEGDIAATAAALQIDPLSRQKLSERFRAHRQ